MIREIDRFRAISDDGEMFTVIEYQTYAEFRSSGEIKRVPAAKELRLTDARHVNYIDPKTFKIVESGQIIQKVS